MRCPSIQPHYPYKTTAPLMGKTVENHSTMADPLSVAASIAGLLTVAGKLVMVTYNFEGRFSDVPESMRSMREEMTSSITVFGQLQELVNSTDLSTHSDRLSMISANSLVDTL